MAASVRLLSCGLLLCLSWSRQGWGQTLAAPTYQWAQAAGGTDDDRGYRLGVDAQGNTYVSGIFHGTATFGTTTLTSRGGYDVFLAKYSATGQFKWVRQLGGPGYETVMGLTVEAAGTVYVTGSFNQAYNAPSPNPLVSLTLDNVTLTGGSTIGEMYVASYDAQGSLNWAKQTKANGALSSSSSGTKVAVDGSGNVYLIGSAAGYTTFDQLALQLPTGLNVFVAKYSRTGDLQWVTTGLGTATGNVEEQLAVDATGQCYVLASFSTTLTLAGTTLTPAQSPSPEAYVAKLDPQGQVRWARQLGTPGAWQRGAGCALDAQGNLLLAFHFVQTVTHGSQTFTSQGGTDVLVLQYSAQGAYRWGRQFGGREPFLNSDQLTALSVDAQGNSYFSLGMWGMSGLTQASGTNQYYAHLVSLAADGTLRWARLSPAVVLGLAASATGEVYTTGHFETRSTFDNLPLTGQGSLEAYVTKLGAGVASPAPSPSPPPVVPHTAPVSMPTPLPPVAGSLVPNIITPNGDGLNEVFRFTGLGAGPWQLQVYSRWGRLVYQQENYQQDWGAAGLPEGLYYYRLQAPQQPAQQGWLQIAR